MPADFALSQKHALITGGTRGIGLAIAEGFLQVGGQVTVCSRRQENVDAAVDNLTKQHDQVQGIAAHVGQPEALPQLLEEAERGLGPIDILVNNAGTNPYFGPIVDATDAAWDKTMDVNLKGPYCLSQLVAQQLQSRGATGSILNIASIAGLSPLPLQGIYSVSKAALIMLTKVLAQELGPQGIRVNCICPGLIKTKLSEAIWSNETLAASTVEAKALRRIGTADELVGAAIYLVSEASSFTTGAVLRVDGGMAL